jgi:hypothetical protein
VQLACATLALLGGATAVAGPPEEWVPARWTGGPVEVARRGGNVPEAIANWYEPATLELLKDTPVNCLLVTLSAGVAAELEERQQQLVKEYARLAHDRRIAVLGVVYPGANPLAVAKAAKEAQVDGVVLDGELSGEAWGSVHAVVIPIASDPAPARRSTARLVAVGGVRPSARDLADMGIRAGPSSEPWIESNIWLVRSFRQGSAPRMVWVNQAPDPSSVGDYIRCVADAAVAGGRWIITFDDELRTKMYNKDAGGLARWRAIAAYATFAEQHGEWRRFTPYGNLAIVLDTAGEYLDVSHEYLNLVARRQVPYRILERCRLDAASLAGFRALLAADLAPPSEKERALLREFAESGGLLIAGPSWGNPPAEDPYAEVHLGKGRVVVYKDHPPDPEAVARDMLELLEPEVMGVTALNVPSVLTYASHAESGKRMLVGLLNYAGLPFDQTITIRVNGTYGNATLYTPENAPLALAVRTVKGRTQVSIPKLAVWGGLMFE